MNPTPCAKIKVKTSECLYMDTRMREYDDITRLNRLCCKLIFTTLPVIPEVRNELSGIHCLVLTIKNATWIPDQLASPLFESATRVRDDGAVIIFYLSHTIGQGLAPCATFIAECRK